MSTAKAKRQPLSDKHKLIVIITAIVLVAVIAVSVTLIVLLQPVEKTSDPNDPSNTVSSNLPVKNGDFGLVSSEDTVYPKSATNWTRYGYKAPNGSSHDFEAIETTENVVMGIVDTNEDEWTKVVENLASEQIELGANPGQYTLPEGEKHSNSNVYMIATKKATNAAIISDSVSVSATTSVKITIRLYTSQIKEGAATIMVQNHSSTPNAKEDNRYAYQYNITAKEGWSEYELHIFNRKTSTQYVRVSVGLGNVYTGDNAQGVLYVDGISYETVTADEYRQKADAELAEGVVDTTYKIIEKEEDTTTPQKSGYLELKDKDANAAKSVDYTDSQAYVAVAGYSPFTNKDDFFKKGEGENADDVATGFGIYKIANDGTIKTPVAMELLNPLELLLDEDNYDVQDYQHVSFWVRTVSLNDNALAQAHILVQKKVGDDWKTFTTDNTSANGVYSTANGEYTIKTEQNIETDTNNGWSKYDIYLKPSRTATQVRIIFALGHADGFENYTNPDYAPNGELYVTTPYWETISISAYTSASNSGDASKKFDIAGKDTTTTITNGTFSTISANTKQPTGWAPAFAGENAIYRDGKGKDDLSASINTDKSAIEGSGVVNWKDEFTSAPDNTYLDDEEGKILKLVSNSRTSYGYVSNEITASAHTVYAFSVLAKVKTDGTGARAIPYFYLLQSGVERDKAILAKVKSAYSTTNIDDMFFNQYESVTDNNSGWVRYYIIYVTGDTDTAVKLALFNGSIDGKTPAEEGATVYYDKVDMQVLGTYSMVEDEDNKDATEYVVNFSAGSDYTHQLSEYKDVDALVAKITEVLDNNAADSIKKPTAEEWTEMKKIPEPTNNDDDDNEEPENPEDTENDVNLALLFSILSSVLLVAALAVVIVIKMFRNKKRSA